VSPERVRQRRRHTSPPPLAPVSSCPLCRVEMKREIIEGRWQHVGFDGTIQAPCRDPKVEWDEKSS